MSLVRIVEADMEGLIAASGVVAKGGVISYPTDTVYGLGCDPFNSHAIESLIEAKGGRSKPLPVLVKALADAKRIAEFSERAITLADRYWPGPLTLVLEAKDLLPVLLAPNGTVGVRAPRHSTCLSLLDLCSGILVGTSANRSGKAPATTAEEVAKELGDQIELVVDGGKATLGVASTVVDLSHGFSLLREGPISREELLKSLRNRR